jgi:hypothetical protein
MKISAVFALCMLCLMFTIPALAWPAVWTGPYAYHGTDAFSFSNEPSYQKPNLFSLANLSTYKKSVTFSLGYSIKNSKNQKPANDSLKSSWNLSWLKGITKNTTNISKNYIYIAKTTSDVPFVYTNNFMSIAGYSSDEILNISESSIFLNGVPKKSTLDSESWSREDFDTKIERDNIIVREEVAKLNESSYGYPSIALIASTFERLKNGDNKTNGFHYMNDPNGMNWAYANESIRVGRSAGYTMAGDCDDFAIVISALVESIGGTSRIVWGQDHAFAEVYLGKDNAQNSDVGRNINWLMNKFSVDKIYTHVDPDNKEVWLNLDFKDTDHPGGPLHKTSKYVIYENRTRKNMIPLMTSP